MHKTYTYTCGCVFVGTLVQVGYEPNTSIDMLSNRSHHFSKHKHVGLLPSNCPALINLETGWYFSLKNFASQCFCDLDYFKYDVYADTYSDCSASSLSLTLSTCIHVYICQGRNHKHVFSFIVFPHAFHSPCLKIYHSGMWLNVRIVQCFEWSTF